MIKKITWLIIIRILLVTSFLSIGAFIFKIDRSFFYFIIALVYLLSIIYLIWLIKRRFLKALLITQLIIDCILESIIVLYTGSVFSIFTTFYLISILYASVAGSSLFGMITTALTSLLYLGQLGIWFYNLVPFIGVKPRTHDISLVIYTANFHIVTFLLVGILSAFLSRRIYQMEEKIKEKERTSLMGELAAQIAHERRNPLATISGSIELLEEGLKSKIDAQDKNLMKAIVTESERVSGIFEQFLDFSKLDSFSYTNISVRELLEEIVVLLKNTSTAQNIILKKEFEDSDYIFEGDRNRIKEVFWNIIHNALQAMPNGGNLTIKTYEKDNDVCVEFSDSGIGIDKKGKKHLFIPFKSTKREGAGLGLVIAHKIIEKHGGNIIVHSEKDKGSTFIVSVPKARNM